MTCGDPLAVKLPPRVPVLPHEVTGPSGNEVALTSTSVAPRETAGSIASELRRVERRVRARGRFFIGEVVTVVLHSRQIVRAFRTPGFGILRNPCSEVDKIFADIDMR